MRPSKEVWIDKIIHGPSKKLTGSCLMSTPKEVAGAEKVEICYLVVGKEGYDGLVEGLYTATNVPPEIYKDNPQIATAIQDQIIADLIGLADEPITFSPKEINIFRSIKFTPAGLTIDDGLIFSLESILPSEVGEKLGDEKDPFCPDKTLTPADKV